MHLRLVKAAVPVEDEVTPAPASDPAVAYEPEELPAGPRSLRSRALADLGDAALVALVVEGESAAAECLYRRHAPFAINLAARIAGSSNDVEDVVHDAFIKALDGLSSLRNAAAFRTWLGSIVVHAMRSRLRRERLRRMLGLGGSARLDIEGIASPGASPMMRAELAQIYALLRTLSADDRIAWTLRHVEGHDLRDAAELAGCSLATIKRRIDRAQRYIEEHFVGASTEAGDLEDEES